MNHIPSESVVGNNEVLSAREIFSVYGMYVLDLDGFSMTAMMMMMMMSRSDC
jgi:hypothetical protein